jgi:hypothetical protein
MSQGRPGTAHGRWAVSPSVFACSRTTKRGLLGAGRRYPDGLSTVLSAMRHRPPGALPVPGGRRNGAAASRRLARLAHLAGGGARARARARTARCAGAAKARDVRSWQTSASRSRTTRIDPNAGGRSTERRRTRLGHEIVFVGGTGIAVPTACATESRLALRGGRSVAVLRPARDSSMRCLINPETVLYLETVSETSGKPSGVLSNRRERAKADLSGFLGSAAWPPQSRTRSGRPRWRPSSRASSARGRGADQVRARSKAA